MTAARAQADNADYRAAGGLAIADAMAIHFALHDARAPDNVTLSSGVKLAIFVSRNGTRRCDVPYKGAGQLRVRAKLMTQNQAKNSHAAERARSGAHITHILPLDAMGQHTAPTCGGDWGMIEGNELKRKCAAVGVGHVQRGPPPPLSGAHVAKLQAEGATPSQFEDEPKGFEAALVAGTDEAIARRKSPAGKSSAESRAAAAPALARAGPDEADTEVEVTGGRTREQRDAELLKRAIDLTAGGAGPPAKQVKKEAEEAQVKKEPPAAEHEAPAAEPAKPTLVQKVGRLRTELGLGGGLTMAQVAATACHELGIELQPTALANVDACIAAL